MHPDLSRCTLMKRCTLHPLTAALQSANIPYRSLDGCFPLPCQWGAKTMLNSSNHLIYLSWNWNPCLINLSRLSNGSLNWRTGIWWHLSHAESGMEHTEYSSTLVGICNTQTTLISGPAWDALDDYRLYPVTTLNICLHHEYCHCIC